MPEAPARAGATRGDVPAVLGLWGFAAATLLGNLADTGLASTGGVWITCLACAGGGAQLVAGTRASRQGDVVGAVSFSAFGFFWLSIAAARVLETAGLLATSSTAASGIYLLVWSVLAGMLTAAAIAAPHDLQLTTATSFLGLLVKGIGLILDSAPIVAVGAGVLLVSAVAAAWTSGALLLHAAARTTSAASPATAHDRDGGGGGS